MASGMRRLWIAIAGSVLASFVGAFVSVCADPYWEDNGVVEFIPWSERWSWAALFTPAFLLPSGVAAYFLWSVLAPQRKP
jgi:hypothetical protein